MSTGLWITCPAYSESDMDRYLSKLIDSLDHWFGVPVSGRKHSTALLTEECEARLGRILSARRVTLYWPVLWEKMRPILAERFPLAAYSAIAAPDQAFHDALERVMEDATRHNGAKLYQEYPELERIDRSICESYASFTDEVFSALEKKRDEISTAFFGGRDFGKITWICLPDESDASTRPGGRSALMLESEGGRFYYKPRNCTVEMVYSQLMERLFPEMGPACDCISGDCASFTEYIKKQPLSSEADADEYYWRMGVLTAVFFSFLSDDMHGGNFIPQVNRPVPIDLETLLTPMPLAIGLPMFRITNLEFLNINSGASPLFIPPSGGGKSSPPELNGRPVSVLGREKPYLSGFSDAYRRIRDNAGAWISILRDHSEMPLRFVPNSHDIYKKILRGITSPELLRSAKARDVWLDRLRAQVADPLDLGMWESEIEDLLHLDMPDYIIRAGGNTVFRQDGTVLSENRLRSPLDFTTKRLNSMSEEELHTACDDLRGLLDNYRRMSENWFTNCK